jgi:hypothetical protein
MVLRGRHLLGSQSYAQPVHREKASAGLRQNTANRSVHPSLCLAPASPWCLLRRR